MRNLREIITLSPREKSIAKRQSTLVKLENKILFDADKIPSIYPDSDLRFVDTLRPLNKKGPIALYETIGGVIIGSSGLTGFGAFLLNSDGVPLIVGSAIVTAVGAKTAIHGLNNYLHCLRKYSQIYFELQDKAKMS